MELKQGKYKIEINELKETQDIKYPTEVKIYEQIVEILDLESIIKAANGLLTSKDKRL